MNQICHALTAKPRLNGQSPYTVGIRKKSQMMLLTARKMSDTFLFFWCQPFWSGKAVTGCIRFVKKTLISFSKKKVRTSETATNGSELIVGRTVIEQAVDLQASFGYLGVPINDISYLFGDKESIFNNSSYPYGRLHKRHSILSFHYLRNMNATGSFVMYDVKSDDNLIYIFTKHWGYRVVYNILRPLFHHVRNTANLYYNKSPDYWVNCFHPFQDPEQEANKW